MSDVELKIQTQPGVVVLTLIRKGRIVATHDGATARQAAERLIRTVNRIADRTEQLVIDLGILTDADIEQALQHTEPRTPPADPGINSSADAGTKEI